MCTHFFLKGSKISFYNFLFQFKKHKISSDYGLINCNSIEKKSILFQQLNDLNCLVFDEYETRLESMRGGSDLRNEQENLRQTYEQLKTRLIEIFSRQYSFFFLNLKWIWNFEIRFDKKNYLKVKHKEYETAVKLAEQYVDFNTLVMICEIRNDMDLLESYLNKFENTVRILPSLFSFKFSN